MKNLRRAIMLFGYTATTLACAAAQTFVRAIPAQASRVATAPLAVAGSMSRAEAVGNPLHLLVGRSMFVNTKARLRRIYVSNPAVLDSFTASPTQIVITAKTAGISSLVLWNETGESQAYLVSADVDVDGLRKSLKEALPYESIRAEGNEDQVSLAGTVSDTAAADTALKLAALYSKNVADSLVLAPQHAKQVRLKVRIVEIDRSKADQAGFNFFSVGKNTSNFTTGQFPAVTTNQNQSSSSSSSSSSAGSTAASLLALSDPLNLLFYNSSLNVGAVVKDLENKQILQILAEPTITTVSGQKASFLSGGEFPFPVIQGGTGGFTSVTIQFRPYGVKLDFTPVVTPEGTIQLKVTPEVSALDYSNAVTISGYTIPALSTRRADTQVELKDGQSFAISGLLDHRTTDLLSKTPGIGDIPVLGTLFKSKSINHSVVELVVIVTPSIVDPLTDSTSPAEPHLAIPTMTPQAFDKTVSKRVQP
ncbi:type II and III secretion system protein family protein [Edaphobacter paludis]|uniref:Type II and III secretion system protein family protein n=1 Tax=Edaphobacter paludis TaxID=3035702 RepID=A0AAU7D320_9BACT